jgi:hypothetical protein
MLPSQFPEVSVTSEPSLQRMLREHLDMQIADLRVLLRLPTKRLPAGCNFTAAAMIFNLIAGSSVCFYNASEKTMEDRPPAGKRFRGLLEEYFPWGAGTVAAKDGARVLWKYSRNPLAHNLGLDEESAPEIQIRKNRVGPTRILALEDSQKLPAWAKPPLRPIGSHYVLDVCGLYWGTHRMLHAVLADDAHRLGAQQLASVLGF